MAQPEDLDRLNFFFDAWLRARYRTPPVPRADSLATLRTPRWHDPVALSPWPTERFGSPAATTARRSLHQLAQLQRLPVSLFRPAPLAEETARVRLVGRSLVMIRPESYHLPPSVTASLDKLALGRFVHDRHLSTKHGQSPLMDRTEQPEQRLLAHVVKAMEPLGLQFRILRREGQPVHHGTDATIGLQFGGRQLRYVAEVKRGLRPATLGAVIHQIRARAGRPLLVADHVTPPLAEALRAQGVEFIDAAGNAFLNQPPLLVFVKGQRPVGQEVALERGRAFQATGLQVLFALLARPALVGRPYREIAAAAGVAHGTVGWVMAELPGLGYLAKVGGGRRVINGERLLD